MLREIVEAIDEYEEKCFIVTLTRSMELIAANGEVLPGSKLEQIKENPNKYQNFLFKTKEAAEKHRKDIGRATVNTITVSEKLKDSAESW